MYFYGNTGDIFLQYFWRKRSIFGVSGYIYREGSYSNEEDIYIDEFKDEIDSWIIDALKAMGCVTAKAVINTPRQDLIDKADLEEDTVDEILEILKAEFED